MKTLNKTLLALVAGTVVTTGANAALYSNTTTGYAGQSYIGIKAGQFNVDLDNVDTDNATAFGVYGGYKFDPNWGVEAEYVGSDNADATFKNTLQGDVTGDYDAKTYGLYGTYNYNFSNTPVYAKAKLGVAKTKIDANANSGAVNYHQSSSDTSLAGGIGLGYNLNPNVGLEAEYDYNNSDSNLWTVGAHMKF